MRGQLTEELKEDLRIKRSLRDREITLTELRLYPYLLYLAMNNGKIEREKVTPEEMRVIKDYIDKGWLKIEPRVKPNEFLWDLMNYVVYKSYVIYDEPKKESTVEEHNTEEEDDDEEDDDDYMPTNYEINELTDIGYGG